MDASARAELAALRIRAYGPAADIDADPTAVARLADLEEAARGERDAEVTVAAEGSLSSAAGAAASGAAAPGAVLPDAIVTSAARPSAQEAALVPPPVVTEPPSRGTERTVLAAIASAAVAVVVTIAVQQITTPTDTAVTAVVRADFVDVGEAYWFVNDLESDVLMTITIDDAVGTDDFPSTRMPDSSFPTSGTVTWVEQLGEYFGWNLWIASAAGAIQEEHCLLIERNGVTRARCVVASLRAQSALLAPVSYRDIPAHERAGVLANGERIGFWWRDSSEVTVIVGPEPERWGG